MIVEMNDSDASRPPDTSGGPGFSVAEDVMSSSRPLAKKQVIKIFPGVYNKPADCPLA